MESKIMFVVFFSLLFSCSKQSKVANEYNNQEVSSITRKEGDNEIKKEMLEGVWAKKENENAWFEIKGDSIQYLEHPESPVRYELKEDTLIIYYEGLTTKNKILKLSSDSLIFKTELDIVNKLYKRK